MSSKKKTRRNPSGGKFKEQRGSSRPRRKFLPPEEPDVSRILKVAGANQLEEPDDSFDHPLHSTAVDAYGEEHSENEPHGHVSGPQRRNAERSEKTSDGDAHKFNRAGPADEPLTESPEAPNTTQFKVKKKWPSRKSTPDPSANSSASVQLWCPKELKRSPRDVTELDVVLAEFEKIAADYRESVESKICRKAISAFCCAFKDQVTDLIMEVQELKNVKKRNAKVVADINKKRQRLLQVREELSRAEPQLTKLQREHAEVEERKSSLRQAVQFLTDLKGLQHDYLDYREENPKEKVVKLKYFRENSDTSLHPEIQRTQKRNSCPQYGTSSLPALLVESRRILGAERHFQNINRKLEYALAAQRDKLSKEH